MSDQVHSIAVVANGEIRNYHTIKPRIQKHDFLVAVDGGLIHCHEMNIRPSIIVGDFDSIPQHLKDHYNDIPILTAPCEKDETDLDLAVEHAIKMHPEKITIFGGLGHRTDHLLSNLHLMRRHPMKVFMESESEKIFAVSGTIEIPCSIGQTISFFSLSGPVGKVKTKGLKWELQNAHFDNDVISISNICLQSPIKISIESGDLVCCLQLSPLQSYP